MWKRRIPKLQALLDSGMSFDQIGLRFGVSKQRIYQVVCQFELSYPSKILSDRKKKGGVKETWLRKVLYMKKVSKIQVLEIVSALDIPDICPILGIKLNFLGNKTGLRADDSPSIDKVFPDKGYKLGNIHIISWRANRIKNDSTPKELKLISDYINNMVDKMTLSGD